MAVRVAAAVCGLADDYAVCTFSHSLCLSGNFGKCGRKLVRINGDRRSFL